MALAAWDADTGYLVLTARRGIAAGATCSMQVSEAAGVRLPGLTLNPKPYTLNLTPSTFCSSSLLLSSLELSDAKFYPKPYTLNLTP